MGWPGSAQRKALGRQGCLRAHWVGLGLSRSQVGLHIPPLHQQLPPLGLTVLLRAQSWRASSLCSWQVRLPGPRWSGDKGVSEQVPWQVIGHLGVSYREERKDGEDGVRAGGFSESPPLPGPPLTGHMARTKVSTPAQAVHSLASPQLPQRLWSGHQAWVLGQQRHLSGQGCLRGGPLPSVSGPQGLGQRRTVRKGAATPHAKGGRPHRGLAAEAAGPTEPRDRGGAAPHGLWSDWEALAAGRSGGHHSTHRSQGGL